MNPNQAIPPAPANGSDHTVVIDGMTINTNASTVYRGIGAITGNNSSRLLMDYKAMHPDAYWQIMRLLFQPDYGAGLTHVKIELGTDVNSSSGTEPCIMRSADETGDVTRGAGFLFAADALTIQPELTVDLLRWGEPKWVTDAFAYGQEAGFAARYRWYKAAIDQAFDTYGIRFSHISADANEAANVDADWIVYLSNALKHETDTRYDYSAIRIVASDEIGTWQIADAMLRDPALRDAVDVLGGHYNTWASADALLLKEQYGKEIWYSEGIAPTNIAKLSVNSNGSGLNGTNGALDVCNRIINGYYHGKMTMYEYQPAVAAYYSGAKYFPKSILNAQTPWSGYYEADCGIWTSAHFTWFAKKGWRYIDSACYGDGKENHYIVETSNNYMTLTDPETGDYSIIISNDSPNTRSYRFTLEHMRKADAPCFLWETRGPDPGQAYDANYFQKIGTVHPVKTDGKYAFFLAVKPFSIVTVTTLDKTADPSVTQCPYEDIPLDANYADDFSYSDTFLRSRGYAPLFTTDYGGAFEVAEMNGNKVLMQKINAANQPTDWRFRGTPYPITSLGDDRWRNYSAEINFLLADDSEANYVLFGVRYLLAELDVNGAENGYALKVMPDGVWQFKKNTDVLQKGTVSGFDNRTWHHLKLTANAQQITASLDGKPLVCYTDRAAYAHSGRICIGSSLFQNMFDHLKISAIEGISSTITRLDDHDASVIYTGDWHRVVPDAYTNFNRTISRAESENAEMSFTFSGSHFAIIGASDAATIAVFVDGNLSETAETEKTAARQCSYAADVPQGEHTVTLRVLRGKYTIDAIEYA